MNSAENEKMTDLFPGKLYELTTGWLSFYFASIEKEVVIGKGERLLFLFESCHGRLLSLVFLSPKHGKTVVCDFGISKGKNYHPSFFELFQEVQCNDE